MKYIVNEMDSQMICEMLNADIMMDWYAVRALFGDVQYPTYKDLDHLAVNGRARIYIDSEGHYEDNWHKIVNILEVEAQKRGLRKKTFSDLHAEQAKIWFPDGVFSIKFFDDKFPYLAGGYRAIPRKAKGFWVVP